MEKIFYSNRIELELTRAYNSSNAAEFKRLYTGVMAPVDKSAYSDITMYYEDVEWDLDGKRQMCGFLSDSNRFEMKVIAEFLS